MEMKQRYLSLPDLKKIEKAETADENEKDQEKRQGTVKSTKIKKLSHSRSFDSKIHCLFIGFKQINNKLEKLQGLVMPMFEEKKKKSSSSSSKSQKKRAIKRRKQQKPKRYHEKLRKANECITEAEIHASAIEKEMNESYSKGSGYETEETNSVFSFDETLDEMRDSMSEQENINGVTIDSNIDIPFVSKKATSSDFHEIINNECIEVIHNRNDDPMCSHMVGIQDSDVVDNLNNQESSDMRDFSIPGEETDSERLTAQRSILLNNTVLLEQQKENISVNQSLNKTKTKPKSVGKFKFGKSYLSVYPNRSGGYYINKTLGMGTVKQTINKLDYNKIKFNEKSEFKSNSAMNLNDDSLNQQRQAFNINQVNLYENEIDMSINLENTVSHTKDQKSALLNNIEACNFFNKIICNDDEVSLKSGVGQQNKTEEQLYKNNLVVNKNSNDEISKNEEIINGIVCEEKIEINYNDLVKKNTSTSLEFKRNEEKPIQFQEKKSNNVLNVENKNLEILIGNQNNNDLSNFNYDSNLKNNNKEMIQEETYSTSFENNQNKYQNEFSKNKAFNLIKQYEKSLIFIQNSQNSSNRSSFSYSGFSNDQLNDLEDLNKKVEHLKLKIKKRSEDLKILSFNMNSSENDFSKFKNILEDIETVIFETCDDIYQISDNVKENVDKLNKEKEEILGNFEYYKKESNHKLYANEELNKAQEFSIQELNNSLSEIKKESKNYRQEIDRLNEELNSVRNKKNEIENNLNEKTANISEMKRNAKRDIQSIQNLQNQLSDVQFALEQETNKVCRLKSDIESLYNTIQMLTDEKNKSENELIENLKKENLNFRKQIVEKTNLIDDLNYENGNLKKKNNELKKGQIQDDVFCSVEMEKSPSINNNCFFRDQIKYSQSAIEKISNSNKELMNTNIALENKVKDLQTQNAELKSYHSTQTHENSETNKNITEQTEIIKKLNFDLEEINNSNSLMKIELNEKKQELAFSITEKNDLMKKLNEIKGELKTVKNQNETLKISKYQEINKSDETISNQNNTINELENRLQTQNKQINNMHVKNQNLQDEITKLNETLKGLTTSNLSLSSELRKKTQELHNMQNEKTKIEQEAKKFQVELKNQNDKQKSYLELHKSQYDLIQSQYQSKCDELRESVKSNQQLQGELENLKKTHLEYFQLQKSQFENIQSQYQSKCNQLKDAFEVNEQNKKEKEILQNEIEKYRHRLELYVEEKQKDLEVIRFNDESNRKKSEELKTKIINLEQWISDKKVSSLNTIKTLSEEKKRLEKTVVEKDNLLNDIKGELNDMVTHTQKYQNYFDHYDNFAKEARELESKYNNLNANYNLKCYQLTTAQKEISNYQNKIKEYEQAANKTQIEIDSLKSEASNFNSKNKIDSKNEINKIKSELEATKSKNNDLENSNNKLNDKIIKQNKYIEYLKKNHYQSGDSSDSSDENDYENSDYESFDDDHNEMDVDEIDCCMVLDGKNPIFPLNEIKNKKNPVSSCQLYNCNGKHNTGYHYSLKSCPKYMQIRKINGDFNTPDQIIFNKKSCIPNFKYWNQGQILEVGKFIQDNRPIFKGEKGGLFYHTDNGKKRWDVMRFIDPKKPHCIQWNT